MLSGCRRLGIAWVFRQKIQNDYECIWDFEAFTFWIAQQWTLPRFPSLAVREKSTVRRGSLCISIIDCHPALVHGSHVASALPVELLHQPLKTQSVTHSYSMQQFFKV